MRCTPNICPLYSFDNIGRAYNYNYDKLEQIRNALYKGNNGSGWNYQNGSFDEKNINYDLNGNILTLERTTLVSGAATPLDNLSYVYNGTGGSDRLKTVTDANGTAPSSSYGFKNQSTDTVHYTYDVNGNILSDKNRNITYTYNDLGKVERVSLTGNRFIKFSYDGMGHVLAGKRV